MRARLGVRQMQMAIIAACAIIVIFASITTVEAQHSKRLRAGLPPLTQQPTAVAAIE